jgi:hypothetical protein
VRISLYFPRQPEDGRTFTNYNIHSSYQGGHCIYGDQQIKDGRAQIPPVIRLLRQHGRSV